ncbi:MAG: FKBP-type peptidyl-prolyl cis-trans isomerase [Coriobacteriia bacterium]
MALKEGSIVKVHYRGTLEDGTEFDSSEGCEPLEFTVGSGQVISGFETAVVDLNPGETATVTITPEEGYGEAIEDARQEVPVESFWEAPEVGMVAQLLAPDGTELAATVVEVNDETAVLDFNHPLAGKTLTFDITLVDVHDGDQPASE